LEGRKKVGTGTYTPGGGGLEADEVWEFIAKSKFSMQKWVYLQDKCKATSRYRPAKSSWKGLRLRRQFPRLRGGEILSLGKVTRPERKCIALHVYALHCMRMSSTLIKWTSHEVFPAGLGF
jgi:hypothetical protein